jgi:hypothetical protein
MTSSLLLPSFLMVSLVLWSTRWVVRSICKRGRICDQGIDDAYFLDLDASKVPSLPRD